MRITFLVSTLMLLVSGCAIHAVQVKTLTIPPRNETVQVTMTCTGTSVDLFLVHQAKAQLSVVSSDGSQAH